VLEVVVRAFRWRGCLDGGVAGTSAEWFGRGGAGFSTRDCLLGRWF
jgi:hypothetical protein